MTQMEKNSDIVVMNCYAPMFVNVNPGARQWRPNLIGYDGAACLRVAELLRDQTVQHEPGRRDSEDHGDRHRRVDVGNTRQQVWHDLRQAGERVRCRRAGPDHPHGNGRARFNCNRVDTVGRSQATNTIDTPERVVPVKSTVTGVKSGFTYTVPKHGIVVLTMRTR